MLIYSYTHMHTHTRHSSLNNRSWRFSLLSGSLHSWSLFLSTFCCFHRFLSPLSSFTETTCLSLSLSHSSFTLLSLTLPLDSLADPVLKHLLRLDVWCASCVATALSSSVCTFVDWWQLSFRKWRWWKQAACSDGVVFCSHFLWLSLKSTANTDTFKMVNICYGYCIFNI